MAKYAVFLGSNSGTKAEYAAMTRQLAATMAKRGDTVVYGGSKVGLMGILADTTLANGGDVIGIIPTFLREKGVAHPDLTQLQEVADMNDRKKAMMEQADGFIVLPGGFGTFEEFFDMLSWSQIGIHKKPIALLNVDNFFTPLVPLFKQVITAGFAPEKNLKLFTITADIDEVFTFLTTFEYPAASKYIN